MDQVMATNGMGSDIGAKAGVGALEQIGRGYEQVKSDLKSAGQNTAVAAGGAAMVAISGYIVRETYYYFRPTPEMVQEKEHHKAERERKVAEDRQRSETARRETEIERCKRDKTKNFQDCLSRNRRSISLSSHGYPEECRDEAMDLSMERDGESEVVRLTRSLIMHAPIKKK